MDKKSIWKGIAALMGVAVLASALIGYRMYTKPHRSVVDEDAIVVGAIELFDAFNRDEANANVKYLNKVLEVTGEASEVTVNMDKKPVVALQTNDLLFGIRCTMQDSLQAVQPGTTITIRGICTGYLSDVVITNGIVME